ncbi:amidohydrolase [Demequina sp. NBRC 110053]|uniref:amidohydrolase n=1 Tax=Demequina sp. NBRC 110053 TaxID=1570342 RepID=UPI001F4877E8|nr:amidohydrolase family protein [Demequina sp. NBRC 110053]
MSDLLLTNARMIAGARPTAIRVRDGLVVDRDAEGRPDEVVDLEGRWVMPGLWDHHVHFTQWAIVRRRLDLSAATSAAGAAQIVAARLRAEISMHEPLIGYGYRDAMWDDEATAAALDEVAPRRPVVILSGDMHACWVNTAARDRYGLPTAGVLREDDAFGLQMRLERAAPGDEDLAITEAAVAAAARGVVGIVDLEMAHNLAGWTERMSRGLYALRVRSGFYPAELDERIEAGWRTGDTVPGTGGLLTIGPLKLITDGSLNTRTAYCHDHYLPLRDTRGVLTVSPELCETLLERATAHGFTVAVHAIGDAAVTHALDAFAATGAQGTIEHAQLVSDDDLARFADLGVAASVQPEHLWDDRDATERFWPDRASRAFPFAALLHSGARLLLGSDAPVAPLDPWRGIAASVHRSADDREPWHPQHSLERREALEAAVGGSVELHDGRVADLAVVDADPLTCDLDELQRMPVAATMTGGVFTHRAL